MAQSKTLLLALLLVLPGCGDDGSGSDADAGAFDQCLSSSDTDVLTMSVGDAGSPDPTGILAICSLQDCYDDLLGGTPEEGAACLSDCWANSPIGGVSSGCKACYFDMNSCIGLECISQCLNGGPDCLPCIETNCYPRRDDCTGL